MMSGCCILDYNDGRSYYYWFGGKIVSGVWKWEDGTDIDSK